MTAQKGAAFLLKIGDGNVPADVLHRCRPAHHPDVDQRRCGGHHQQGFGRLARAAVGRGHALGLGQRGRHLPRRDRRERRSAPTRSTATIEEYELSFEGGETAARQIPGPAARLRRRFQRRAKLHAPARKLGPGGAGMSPAAIRCAARPRCSSPGRARTAAPDLRRAGRRRGGTRPAVRAGRARGRGQVALTEMAGAVLALPGRARRADPRGRRRGGDGAGPRRERQAAARAARRDPARARVTGTSRDARARACARSPRAHSAGGRHEFWAATPAELAACLADPAAPARAPLARARSRPTDGRRSRWTRVDELLVEVRASTQGFTQDIAQMRGQFDGTLVDGFARAGNVLERGLLTAIRKGGLGFEDLQRTALSAFDQIAARALHSGSTSSSAEPARAGGGHRRSARRRARRAARPAGARHRRPGQPRARLYGRRARAGDVRAHQRRADRDRRQRADGRATCACRSTCPRPRGASAPTAMQRSSRQVASAVRRALTEF